MVLSMAPPTTTLGVPCPHGAYRLNSGTGGIGGRAAAAVGAFLVGTSAILLATSSAAQGTPLDYSRPRVDPPAVLVRLRPGVEAPRGALALGQAPSGPRAAQGAPTMRLETTGPFSLGLEATPDLAARALNSRVQAIEAPFRLLALEEPLDAVDGPGGRLARTYRLVLAPGADPRAAAAELALAAEVESAQPDMLYHATWTDGGRFMAPAGHIATGALLPDDPLFSDGTQWGLANTGSGQFGGIAGNDVGAPAGWAITTGSSGTTLGIVDTGFDLHHPELNRDFADGSPRVVARFNSSVEGEFATTDDSVGHGTIVAGVALALTNNGPQLGRGVAGVCGGGGGDSLGCRVIEVKATPTSHTDVLASELGSGIVFAAVRGARAINLSFGGDEDNDTVREAIAYAATRGAVVVCGAGNGQDERPQYPGYYARYGLGVSVAAIKSDGTLALFSSRGPQIDVAAPGEKIMSTYLTYQNAYGSLLRDFVAGSGTSFAAPFVTGLAGLAYTLQPSMQHNEFQEVLRRTARDVGAAGRDDTYGWGVPDAPALLTALLPPRGFLRGRARAQSWALVGVDTVTLAKNKLTINGCSVDGRYLAERWEARAHVNLPPGRMLETPEVIVRKSEPQPGVGSTGWGPGPLLEYNVGWGELVPGTASPDGFDVRAYVYHIASPPQLCGGTGDIEYLPVLPKDVYFEWSALGRLDQPPVLTVDVPGDGATLDVDQPTALKFQATDTDAVSALEVALSSDAGITWTTLANLPGNATDFEFHSPCSQPGKTYQLRFRAIDRQGGWTDQSEVVRSYLPSRVCLDGEHPDEPIQFAFLAVTPNPSAGLQSTFHFYLPGITGGSAATAPRIRIFDLRGRLLREIMLPVGASGPNGVAWDGLDQEGRSAPAGFYLARLEAGDRSAVRRFVRLTPGR